MGIVTHILERLCLERREAAKNNSSESQGTMPQGVMSRCRYNKNDVLYVRETWKQATACPAGGGYDLRDYYLYKADEPQDTSWAMVEDKWHPSIHMPKEAARIFLRVTDVRVERLQDMTCDDMLAEGVIPKTVKGGSWQQWQQDYMRPVWNSTINPSEYGLYSWDTNPWVWVIEFKRISKKEAENLCR